MTALAIGKTHKAEIQLQLPSSPVKTNEPLGVTHRVPFEHVKDLIEAGRSPRRPNRNRPVNSDAPSLDELLVMAAENPPPSEFFAGEVERPW
jgi:hypothetical protein